MIDPVFASSLEAAAAIAYAEHCVKFPAQPLDYDQFKVIFTLGALWEVNRACAGYPDTFDEVPGG